MGVAFASQSANTAVTYTRIAARLSGRGVRPGSIRMGSRSSCGFDTPSSTVIRGGVQPASIGSQH